MGCRKPRCVLLLWSYDGGHVLEHISVGLEEVVGSGRADILRPTRLYIISVAGPEYRKCPYPMDAEVEMGLGEEVDHAMEV